MRRSRRAQRNHIGFALRALSRLEWHFLTTGISGFEAKLRLIRKAVQSDLETLNFAYQNPQLRNFYCNAR